MAILANYSAQFFDCVGAFTTVIGDLSEKESIGPIIKLMNKNIREEITREKFLSMKSKIATTESRLKKICDSNLRKFDARCHAIVAANTCEAICANPIRMKASCGVTGVTPSSILSPSSVTHTHVSKFN